MRLFQRNRLFANSRGWSAAWLLAFPLSLGLAQEIQPVMNRTDALSEVRYRKEYVVLPGDQLDVVVRRVPEASRSVVVRPDGQITLPIVNDLQVAGLTTREIDGKIEGLLERRLLKPEVTVIAAQAHQATVYVGGEVNVPSSQALRNAATAAQAVSLAGGLRRTANGRGIVVIRLADDGMLQTIKPDVQGRGDRAVFEALSKMRLYADDIVFVPESGRSKMTRFIDDFLNRPLQGTNAILGTYVNFRLVQILNQQVR